MAIVVDTKDYLLSLFLVVPQDFGCPEIVGQTGMFLLDDGILHSTAEHARRGMARQSSEFELFCFLHACTKNIFGVS